MAAKIDPSQSRSAYSYTDGSSPTSNAATVPLSSAANLPGTVDVRGVEDVAKSTQSIANHKDAPFLPQAQAAGQDFGGLTTNVASKIQQVVSMITELALVFAKMYNLMQETETKEKNAAIEAVAEKMKVEANQIRESAAFTLAAGVITGSMQIVSAGVTAAQLKGSIGGAKSPTTEETPPTPPTPELPESESGLNSLGENEEPLSPPGAEGEMPGLSPSEEGVGGQQASGVGRSEGGEDAPDLSGLEESRQTSETRAADERVTEQEQTRTRNRRSTEQEPSSPSTESKKKPPKMTDGEMFLLGQREARITMKAQAMTQAMTGAGGILASGVKMGADEKSAEEKETEAGIEKERAYKSSLDDFVQDARDSMQKMMRMAADIQQALDETTQKIAER